MPQFPNRERRKTQVEECLPLDARALLRRAAMNTGASIRFDWRLPYLSDIASAQVQINAPKSFFSDNPTLTLRYGFDRFTNWPKTELSKGECGTVEYFINTDATLQKLGGSRLWFLCPLMMNGHACSRRVRVLYLPQGAHYFGCRHCYDLAYRSSQESKTKLEAIRKKVRFARSFSHGFGIQTQE